MCMRCLKTITHDGHVTFSPVPAYCPLSDGHDKTESRTCSVPKRCKYRPRSIVSVWSRRQRLTFPSLSSLSHEQKDEREERIGDDSTG
jgi:hypothetical protein